MLKRKSFMIIIIALFWVGYIMLSLGQIVFTTADHKKFSDEARYKQIDHLLSISQTLVMTGNIDALKVHLDEAIELKLINYYCIKEKDQIVHQMSVGETEGCKKIIDPGVFSRGIASYGQGLKYPKLYVKPIKIENHIVGVGFATEFWSFFWDGHKTNVYIFIKDVLIITTFLSVLVYLIMKDFLMLDRLLQKGSKADISKIKARSKEAQTLIDSTTALDNLNSQQSHMIHHLQNTVGLAIHSEIDNKTPHLTQIPSAVVRIDLNGYTQIFLEKKEEHIVTVLNEYFSVTSDLIKRFSGEIYQIIGDEIIFVLKNQDPRNALFCVRAIFEWADQLDRKIQAQHKHRFLLKASISYGSLKFVQLNNGYAFAGVPLIESVRLLGCVSDKSENTLILKREDALSAWPFIKNHYLKDVDLKGFEEKSEIVEIKEFVTLEEFFNRSLLNANESELRETMKSLTYFRGQYDIATALQMLNWNLSDQSWTECFYLVQHLKDLRLGIKSEAAAKQLFQILSDHFQLITSKSSTYPFLNSVVLMTEALVHPDLWTIHWAQLLKNYLLCNQARIVANATEVLCRFGFDSKEMQAILLNWKDNNRVSANFLLSEMKKSVVKPNVKAIINWLDSTHILFQASALYVIEETLKHYQINDPIVFKTNNLLADCVTASEKFKNSDNPLIKGRFEKLEVLLASKKSQDSRRPGAA